MDKKSRILKERAMKKCVALISFLMFLPVYGTGTEGVSD